VDAAIPVLVGSGPDAIRWEAKATGREEAAVEDARGACTVAAAGRQRVPSARKWAPAVIARLVENVMLSA
jgi:hypothetical protein